VSEGIAPATDRDAPVRHYAGKCGLGFLCGGNNQLPGAWGAVKVMLALGRWPIERRTPLMERAIRQGLDFLRCTLMPLWLADSLGRYRPATADCQAMTQGTFDLGHLGRRKPADL
jgi:hypothetical protein